jgi:hypothetical protein
MKRPPVILCRWPQWYLSPSYRRKVADIERNLRRVSAEVWATHEELHPLPEFDPTCRVCVSRRRRVEEGTWDG